MSIARDVDFVEGKRTKLSHLGEINHSHLMTKIFQGRHIPDMHDPAHVSGWDPYNLRDLAHDSWVGSVLYISCTTSHNDRLGSRLSRS